MTLSQVGPPEAQPTSSSRSASPPGRLRGGRVLVVASVSLVLAVLVLSALSLSVGAGEVGPGDVLNYLLGRDGARDSSRLSLVIGDLRIPRTLTALAVGAALGTAGCLLQAVTRNPLAETGLLGVNAGASLGVVVGIAFLGVQSGLGYLLWAFGGAVVASSLVLLIAGRRGGGSPMRLVLAGSALGATFGGVTSVLIVNSAETYDRFRFWVLGSLAGVEGFGKLSGLAPVLAVGFVVALLVARPLSALALGDDLARGLGHRPGAVRVVVALSVTLLTAASVALVGPISFLGLLAGFLARAVTGPRLLAQIVLAGLIGAGVLTGSDILARVVSRPFEAPVSVVIALFGAPVLIAIVRSKRLGAMGMTEPATAETSGPGKRLLPPLPRLPRPARPARKRADSLVVRRGPLSLLVPRRAALAALFLSALLVAAVVLSAYAGQSDMGITRTFNAVFGSGDRFDVLLVQKFRLGRIVAGLAAGAALGLAGCLTQTLARNRLATPELLGVNDGATAAVLLSATLSGTFGAWWAGPVGALAAVLVVTTVSGGLGQRGYRVLVVGLAMSALASAVTQVVLSRRSLNSASSLYVWTSGSLNGRGYSVAVPVLIGLAVLVPLALVVARHLNVLRFDDSTAASLGVSAARVRLVCLLLAVGLAGLAVGICGPVGFVALAAPVVAGRLAGPLRVPVLGSMLVGAVLIVLADTLGRIVLDGVEIPVGIVTTVLGGPFLLWVLLGRSAATRV
ncbi:Fe(3+)-hydroxamate ABC transporter permease FhuB [Streptomyces albireticuli]|uniref:Fe(3+)-hydroxamate ABC transporter permease FhuB n=1 Tax=Streptomyces albireticuli TaxID=1940 RepID=A0A2A2DEK1_9ACTN|nr:Fe(3+)-hydroxamate ABC transporter permease FhuB [Streptomyces albireticuli]MCD9141043.1 Fe(3+)-hydroxamate ABC transporter permease FhuB [Streptomyces albireticuli]MCD9160995.1 Fe(3+)-hydroxamate ABC transporter permease FhuB [Streptomyces albireticuli]MCD9190947.1 Fe(3+)-hydroxamate ABC transporter permease FhuB [Streptomyces albireticuli]PAU49760.1 Fe(3+)-hydroxamate ABC transporter permease FhuB [Streptomyces albireticuli]